MMTILLNSIKCAQEKQAKDNLNFSSDAFMPFSPLGKGYFS